MARIRTRRRALFEIAGFGLALLVFVLALGFAVRLLDGLQVSRGLRTALMALLALGAPWIMHAGAIGGDRWKPHPKGYLSGDLGRKLIRYMPLIFLANGVFFSSAYLLWELREDQLFLIPLLLSAPTIIAQTILAGASAAQSNR